MISIYKIYPSPTELTINRESKEDLFEVEPVLKINPSTFCDPRGKHFSRIYLQILDDQRKGISLASEIMISYDLSY